MNGALKWKLVAGFVLVFVAGGIAGAALGGFYARHLFIEFHRPGRVGDRMKERLRTELRLTPEQVAKISPIVDKTAARLQETGGPSSRSARIRSRITAGDALVTRAILPASAERDPALISRQDCLLHGALEA